MEKAVSYFWTCTVPLWRKPGSSRHPLLRFSTKLKHYSVEAPTNWEHFFFCSFLHLFPFYFQSFQPPPSSQMFAVVDHVACWSYLVKNVASANCRVPFLKFVVSFSLERIHDIFLYHRPPSPRAETSSWLYHFPLEKVHWFKKHKKRLYFINLFKKKKIWGCDWCLPRSFIHIAFFVLEYSHRFVRSLFLHPRRPTASVSVYNSLILCTKMIM